MFPLNDFNLVCCALATVTAAVGYGYSRRYPERPLRLSRAFNFALHPRKTRRDSTASDVSCASPISVDTDSSDFGFVSVDYPTPESIADITEPDSLKRKRRDEEDPVNSNDDTDCCTPPAKRHRASPEPDEQPTIISIEIESPETAIELVEQQAVAAMEEAPGPERENPSPSSTIATSALNQAAYTIPAYKPSNAFSAFAGSSAPFSFATSSAGCQRPAWCIENSIPAAAEAAVLKEVEMTHSEGNTGTRTATPVEQYDDPLAAQSCTQTTHTSISGEEGEDIKAELKGVKLFIKRGNKEFSTGMLGHIKFLCDKATDEERLVFRREPVWKVSMSVRLRPSIRCSFDEDQGVLRLALMEKEGEGDAQQLVVYALKRGKTSKPDFTTFVQRILKSSQLFVSAKPFV